MGPITNSRCSSTTAPSPGQPDTPLAMAMAPQHVVPCPWSSSAWQTALPQHKHVPTVTEVTLSLLCVHCWFLRDGSCAFLEIGPWDMSHQLLILLVPPPFEQLG